MKKNFLFLGALLSLPLLCGRDLYVSTGGNDKNPGTKNAPLATVGCAVAKAKPGDTVKIGPGIYREEVTIRKSGKKGAPIAFEGVRDKNGKWLSIIESPGMTLDKWQAAPEIGPGVWKCKLEKSPTLVMMDGKTIAKINDTTMGLKRWKEVPVHLIQTHFMSKFGPNCKRLPGMDFFILSKDATLSHIYFGKVRQAVWPVLGYVICGWQKGWLYLRFLDGQTPDKHRFTASYGNGFTIQNASYLKFRNLFLRGSRSQFLVTGKSSHITIEDSLMMHGGYRVRLEKDASFITVRNNVMTSGFITGEYFKHRWPADQRGGLIYTLFKYLIGHSRSDDVGVYCMASDSLIENNVVVQGLIGIDAFAPRLTVRNNVVRGMASIGIGTGAVTTGQFYRNLIMHCGIPLRIHAIRHERAKREEFHFNNVYMQGENGGGFTFCHCESYKTRADSMNFDGQVYKKNPPSPVDPGRVYIYHNTFWGGDNVGPAFSARRLARRFREPMPFTFINNVVKDSYRFDGKSHRGIAGNLLFRSVAPVKVEKRTDLDIPKYNRILSLNESAKLWYPGKSTGMPQLALAPDFAQAACAVDVSRPFTAGGITFAALPGFAPGYYKGSAPFAGALQKGESDEHFRTLWNKAQNVYDMLKDMKY